MPSDVLTIGFVPIARTTFDIPLAEGMTDQVRAALTGAGMTLVGGETLVTDLDAIEDTILHLAAEPLDALLVFQASFADSTMIMRLVEALAAPLIMWAVPEERTGGRLRLNSFCGVNLAAHGLARAGYTYDTIVALPDDAAALEQVQTVARAGRVCRRLAEARIGRVGDHPAGFDTCRVNPSALKSIFGLDVVTIALDTVFDGARAAEQQAVATVVDQLSDQIDGLADVDQPALQGTVGAYLTLRHLAEDKQLDGFAVRCWPEFFTNLGCAACGSSSMLNNELIPASCEADVNGTITQLILQWISGEPAFGSDVVAFDTAEDLVVFWHCGKAPLAMADPTVRPRATIHSNRQLPLLMEFPLKPGRVTVARLSEATGEYRLVIGSADVIQAPISFTGTSGVLRFDRPADDVQDIILSEGLEHHLALTYGNHLSSLIALAKMLNLPILHL
ncbi:MAG: fucose isomerase [Chloroflexi bacterium]|nr:fucose isomerase [Chloroflexota bacterium]